MSCFDTPDNAGGTSISTFHAELDPRLCSLSLLVCELLRTNQELREALRKARLNPNPSQRPQ
jgi:hypothetical protein